MQNGGKEARQKAERTPRNSRSPSKDGTVSGKKKPVKKVEVFQKASGK